MFFRLREVSLRLGENEEALPQKIADQLEIPLAKITNIKIVRKGIDARKKPNVLRIYTIEFMVADGPALIDKHRENSYLSKVELQAEQGVFSLTKRPSILVVGMGPAGLFSALQLAEAGAQVRLIERGRPVAERFRDVRRFWNGGSLDLKSNIQFGEGGAGTFSDGKLTTRLNQPLIRQVLSSLVRFGAPEEILWQAKPHVGSDRLRRVLVNIRNHLLALGVDIRYSTKLTGLELNQGRVCGGQTDHDESFSADHLVLALGHSARDTYEMLQTSGVNMQVKPFAIGLRVEHPLEMINSIQYGMAGHPQLPAAEYSLTWNDSHTGRGVYSFCMCPGGMVVNAASEAGGVVVNGMSNYRRDAQFSNSALVVTVRPDDFPGKDPLAGIRFQRQWERAAFIAGGGNWQAPAQPLLEFLGKNGGRLESSCQPQVAHADLTTVLPTFVSDSLRQALPHFNRRMRGFICAEATMVGVETRTSAPLRIVRDQQHESISHRGLFPAGEGAGYAGGIMSSAVDGLKVATSILQRYQ